MIQQFKKWMLVAESFKSKSPDFWAGYMRGLRRLHHGVNFGTEEEHFLWLNIPSDERDLTRCAMGEGYRAGFSGKNPTLLTRPMAPAEIKVWRAELQLTQTQAAELVGAGSYRTWQDWERGERRIPEWLPKMIKLLNQASIAT